MRVAGWLLLIGVLAGSPGLAESPPGATTPKVILKDGTVVLCLKPPLVAFGQVRFTTRDGKHHVLDKSQVDLARTRAANAGRGPRAGTVLTNDDLGKIEDRVRLPEARENHDDRAGGKAAPPGKSPPVTVYSATWCGYCRKLKQFLKQHGIPHKIIEVDRLAGQARAAALRKMKALAGRIAYPVTQVGDQTVVGFNQARLKRLLGLE